MGMQLKNPDGAELRYWKFLAEMLFGKLSGRNDTLGGIR